MKRVMGERGRMADGPRWTAAKKEALVLRVRAGELTRDEAADQHGLSPEELDSWCARFQAHGRRGLAATKLQETRP